MHNRKRTVSKSLAFAAGSAAASILMMAAPTVVRAEEKPGRYSMTPTEGGFVRLDTETGAMSFCSGKEGAWSCAPMPDGEKKLEGRIEELERENKALKESRKLSDAAPDASPPSDVPTPPGELNMPTERDVDKLFDYVEGMVKKFKERIERLEKEAQKDQTPL